MDIMLPSPDGREGWRESRGITGQQERRDREEMERGKGERGGSEGVGLFPVEVSTHLVNTGRDPLIRATQLRPSTTPTTTTTTQATGMARAGPGRGTVVNGKKIKRKIKTENSNR